MECLTSKYQTGIWQSAGFSRSSSGPATCFYGDTLMKLIRLTHGKVALVDDEDFDSVRRFQWHVSSQDYAETTTYVGSIGGQHKYTYMSLHRLILHPPKGLEVDHINHDTLDCRRANIRVCTKSQNQHNQLKQKGSSKFKGVSWHRRATKWTAKLQSDGKQIHLGYFHDEEVAARAYDTKAKELFGEFAHTNLNSTRKDTD